MPSRNRCSRGVLLSFRERYLGVWGADARRAAVEGDAPFLPGIRLLRELPRDRGATDPGWVVAPRARRELQGLRRLGHMPTLPWGTNSLARDVAGAPDSSPSAPETTTGDSAG